MADAIPSRQIARRTDRSRHSLTVRAVVGAVRLSARHGVGSTNRGGNDELPVHWHPCVDFTTLSTAVGSRALGFAQHPDDDRSHRVVFLDVDQELTELRVAG